MKKLSEQEKQELYGELDREKVDARYYSRLGTAKAVLMKYNEASKRVQELRARLYADD